jgi:hypothetical protein
LLGMGVLGVTKIMGGKLLVDIQAGYRLYGDIRAVPFRDRNMDKSLI